MFLFNLYSFHIFVSYYHIKQVVEVNDRPLNIDINFLTMWDDGYLLIVHFINAYSKIHVKCMSYFSAVP